MKRAELIKLTNNFVDAFNRNDLDAVMAFFTADACYDEFNGKRNLGTAAIRAAFTPQFAGAYGKMQFLDEDIFADAETGKVMVSWRCTLTVKGTPTSWRGLDLLHFVGDRIAQKLTYAKTKVPLFAD